MPVDEKKLEIIDFDMQLRVRELVKDLTDLLIGVDFADDPELRDKAITLGELSAEEFENASDPIGFLENRAQEFHARTVAEIIVISAMMEHLGKRGEQSLALHALLHAFAVEKGIELKEPSA